MSATFLANIRVSVLGLTGLVCLAYAVAAIMTGRPDPFPAWIPGAFGFGSAALIGIGAVMAGQRTARMATDEGYLADSRKAQSHAYWIALLLYPGFAVLLAQGIVTWQVAFAAMGTLTGAAFLLLFVLFDLRGRG